MENVLLERRREAQKDRDAKTKGLGNGIGARFAEVSAAADKPDARAEEAREKAKQEAQDLDAVIEHRVRKKSRNHRRGMEKGRIAAQPEGLRGDGDGTASSSDLGADFDFGDAAVDDVGVAVGTVCAAAAYDEDGDDDLSIPTREFLVAKLG